MRKRKLCAPHQTLLGCKTEEDKMDGTCSRNGVHKKWIWNFSQKPSREEITLDTWYNIKMDVVWNVFNWLRL